MRSLKKYIYPTLSDRVYEILGENYFLILYPVLLFFIIAELLEHIFNNYKSSKTIHPPHNVIKNLIIPKKITDGNIHNN